MIGRFVLDLFRSFLPQHSYEFVTMAPLVLELAASGFSYHSPKPLREFLRGSFYPLSTVQCGKTHDALQRILLPWPLLFVPQHAADFTPVARMDT